MEQNFLLDLINHPAFAEVNKIVGLCDPNEEITIIMKKIDMYLNNYLEYLNMSDKEKIDYIKNFFTFIF